MGSLLTCAAQTPARHRKLILACALTSSYSRSIVTSHTRTGNVTGSGGGADALISRPLLILSLYNNLVKLHGSDDSRSAA